MKFASSSMLLASILVWLHASRPVSAVVHPPQRPQRERPVPDAPLRAGPVLQISHPTTMGERTITTPNDVMQNESSPPTVVLASTPAETNISINTSHEFIDVFCFLGLFIPVLYLCQARLRKAILYVLSITIPIFCATYLCLRQWRIIKHFLKNRTTEVTSYIRELTSTPTLSSSTTSWILVVVIVGLLAREWGLFHALYYYFSRALKSLKSAMAPVHSPSIAISLVDSDLSTTENINDKEINPRRRFGIFDNQLTEEQISKLKKLLDKDNPRSEPTTRQRPRKLQPIPQPPVLQEGEDEFSTPENIQAFSNENIQQDLEDTIYNSLPLFDYETYLAVTDQIAEHMTEEENDDDNFNFCASLLPYDHAIINTMTFPGIADTPTTMKDIYETNPDITPEDMLTKLYQVVKENRKVARMPKPIPTQFLENITDINGLRRYMTENSAREKLWMKEGKKSPPTNLPSMTVPEIAAWLRDWREAVWITHMGTRGIVLERCQQCGLTVKKDEHQCFIGKSKQITYEKGIPIQKTLKVVGQGARVKTFQKKQVHLDTATKNYDRARNYLSSHTTPPNQILVQQQKKQDEEEEIERLSRLPLTNPPQPQKTPQPVEYDVEMTPHEIAPENEIMTDDPIKTLSTAAVKSSFDDLSSDKLYRYIKDALRELTNEKELMSLNNRGTDLKAKISIDAPLLQAPSSSSNSIPNNAGQSRHF